MNAIANIPWKPSGYAPFMQTAMIDIGEGIELCVEVGGNAKNPPILLIMGLGAQMLYWPDDFIKKLIDAGYYVVRYDNRDIGLSTKFKIQGAPRPNLTRLMSRNALGLATHNEPLPYNLHDMAEDASRLIGALGLGKTHIIGGSMGGMIAQILAAKHPHQIKSLGLLFTSNNRAFLPPPYPKQLNALFAKPKNHDEETMALHGAKMFQAIGSPGHVDPKEAKAEARKYYRRSFHPLGYMQHFNAILATGSLVKYDRRIKAPTIVVHGSKDRLIHPRHGKAVAKAIKGAHYHEINGMGHDLPRIFQDELAHVFTQHFAKHKIH